MARKHGHIVAAVLLRAQLCSLTFFKFCIFSSPSSLFLFLFSLANNLTSLALTTVFPHFWNYFFIVLLYYIALPLCAFFVLQPSSSQHLEGEEGGEGEREEGKGRRVGRVNGRRGRGGRGRGGEAEKRSNK